MMPHDSGDNERLEVVYEQNQYRGPPDWLGYCLAVILASVLILLYLMFTAILAHSEPPKHMAHPEWHAWFERQHSASGAWCCDVSDGHIISDEDWKMGESSYSVRIEGAWYPVPSDAIRDPVGGPNPTGKAIVWYLIGTTGPVIYCFAPGTLF